MATEAWRHTWRKGFAPQFTTNELRMLERALRTNDPALIQGQTTNPPPSTTAESHAVCCGACAVGYPFWSGRHLSSVGQVEEAFARACAIADVNLGFMTACRHLMTWWDETPRDVAVSELLAEVTSELKCRDRQAVAA